MKPAGLRLACLAALLLVASPIALLPVHAEKPTESKGLAAVLQPFVDSQTLAGGVMLVASRDKVLDIETVGFADIAAKKPMKPDTIFWIASMSKPITAAGLMILVDEGKVKIDDPVEKYLPEFKEQMLEVVKGAEKGLKKPNRITIKNILTHTSGMPFKSAKETPTLDRLTLADAARSYAETPLQFDPDTKHQYSNAGINTAGRIIEVVSGMPYEKFMQERLFDPLGMKDTTFWPNEEQLTRLAKTYKANAEKTGLEETTIGQLSYPLNDRKRQPMPAGGLFSTANDVGNFCRMVLAGGVFNGKRILSEKAVQEMTAVHTAQGLPGWGLGWTVERRPGGTFGHGGAFNTNMKIDPQKGLVLVLLVHHAGFRGKDDSKNIHQAFTRAALEKYGK